MDAHEHIDATATASAIHRFNRYEIKYLVPEHRVPQLRELLARRMAADSNTGGRLERVSSLYYDTRDYRCYWEKIEGLRFRRKLRIRAYGEPGAINDDTQVFVEIKQRTNRVTQKRRIELPYRYARMLCAGQTLPDHLKVRPAFSNEVLAMVGGGDLQPTAVTTYLRDPFVGVDADLGMRITIDHRVCGRSRDLDLSAVATSQFLLPQELAVVEVKANERVPTWFTDLAAELELATARISKYCKAIEATTHAVLREKRGRGHPREDSTRRENMP